jgi:uncharacterized membrane protein YfcA
MPENFGTYLFLCLTALAAGAVNSVAGGGTILTFPSLLAVVSPVVANATSTVALVPASLASAWGYRREMKECRRWVLLLTLPNILGGALGALLVTVLDEEYFRALIPWLLLTAAILFLVQPLLGKRTGIGARPPVGQASPLSTGGTPVPPDWSLVRGRQGWGVAGIVFFQFLVAIYGGYFGAGMGILMLAALGFVGLWDIHQMNGLKNVLGACINGVAVVVFVAQRKVDWNYALVMAVAAIVGGYLGARFARRLDRNVVRWIVIAIGFGLAAYYFFQQATGASQ